MVYWNQHTAHEIRCQCGSFIGEVTNTCSAIHAVCYCIDCRIYAVCLYKLEEVLDEMGGTEVVATQARYVKFTHGAQNLACLSLYPKGSLRWYAKCCNTPIANTPSDWRLPYVCLIHTCLRKPLGDSFPSIQMHVKTKSAKGRPPPMVWSKFITLAGFMPRFAAARLLGSYKQTPFFLPSGTPRVEVQKITDAQRAKLKCEALM